MSLMEESREDQKAPHGPPMGVLGHQEAPHQAARVAGENSEVVGSPLSMPTPPRHDPQPSPIAQLLDADSMDDSPSPRRASELAASLAAVGDVEHVAWWRRLLRRGPSAQSVEVANRRAALRTVFADPLVVVVASPKGSAGKTPTARALGAAFGRERGGGVAVVDMNELRGTLAERSVVTHDGHIGHLVSSAEYLLSAEARSVEVERCMNRQPDSFEWVLASDPSTTEPMSFDDFAKVIAILKRFFSIIIFDTGNAELASSWQAATRVADLIVVPMKWRADNLNPAAKMLEDMHHRGEVVEGRTVVLGTNGANEANAAARAEAVEYFDHLPIFEVPVDKGLDQQIIRWNRLNPATQTAFENVGAELITLAQGAHHV